MKEIERKTHRHRNCQPANQSVENNSSKPNYLPWILGGVGVIGLIGVVVYFLIRKGEDK